MKNILIGVGTSIALIGSYYTYQKYCYEKKINMQKNNIEKIDQNTQTEIPIKKIDKIIKNDNKIVKEIIDDMVDDIEYNLTKKYTVKFNNDFEIIDH